MKNRHDMPARFSKGERWSLAILPGLVWVALALAAMDAWQRPGFFSGWHGGWFPLVAVAATAVWIRILTRGLEPRRRWLRAAIIVTGVFIVASGLRLGSDSVAARSLARQMSDPAQTHRNEWIATVLDWTVDRLDDIGLPSGWVPEPYYRSELETARYHHLKASRPSLRLRFAREAMIIAEKGPLARPGRLAVTKWHRLFPAVTGPDVTLRQRQRLWNSARELHDDKRAAEDSRMAAALWMGLVVLTDPEAFADQRASARDAMLHWHDPPMADTGDIWMRTLDLLLLPDPQDLQTRITAEAASHPAWLRRAIRERVRAVRGHLRPALDELASRGGDDPVKDGIALWCDLATYLRYVGDDGNVQLENSLRTILIEWLHGEWTGKQDSYISPWETRWWGFLFRQTGGFPFGPAQDSKERQRLRERAEELLERLEAARTRHLAERDKPAISWLDDMDRLLIARHLLDDAGGKRFAVRLGDLLVDLAWAGFESTKDPSQRVWAAQEEALHRLGGIWTDIDPADRIRFGRMAAAALVPSQMIHSHPHGYDNLDSVLRAVALDAASEYPQVDVAARLLVSLSRFHAGPYRRPAGGGPAQPLGGPLGYFRFPELSDEESEAAIPRILDALEDKPFNFGNHMIKSIIIRLQRSMRDLTTTSEKESLLRALLAASGFRHSETDMTALFLILTGSQPSLLKPLLNLRHLWIPGHFADWAISSPERLMKLLDAKPDEFVMLALMERLEQGRQNPESIRIAREHFERASRMADPAVAFEALACLLRLAPQLDAEAAESIRRRFPREIQQHKPSLEAWPNDFSTVSGASGRFLWMPFTPRSHWSEGVPWADDELAARFGWSSEIKIQVMYTEGWGFLTPPESTDIFASLAGATKIDVSVWDDVIDFPDISEPVDFMAWRYSPPALPFEPTPWQRARELHQRRPDLRFPDRAMLRPIRSNAN